MFLQKINQLKNSLTPKERVFVFFAMLAGFLIGADYAIIRPVSHSIFIHFHGAQAFPYAWLYALPFNLGVVALYNFLLPKVGCFRFFWITAVIVMLGNAIAGLFILQSSWFCYVFYIWKELYVLLMLQQLWSVIHMTIHLKNAKYLYGILFGFGALGGCLGSLIPGFFAVRIGSESLLFSTIPLYFILIYSYFKLLRYSGAANESKIKETSNFSSLAQGVKLISSSRLLIAILCMTFFMQITATITDFQFQFFLEDAYPNKDIRTEFFGKILSLGNVMTMSFQFFGTFLLVRAIGMQNAHLSVPLVMSIITSSFILFPSMGPMTCCFLCIKCFDFSLFCVIKEMLYIPMRQEEKFQAKALIDVFMSRASKVIASLVILFFQFFFQTHSFVILSWVNLGFFIIWCVLIITITADYKACAEASSKTEDLGTS